jgi:catechol 2,3-dioxygenase-like lactoylglutathione lyase family enzyme
MMKRFHVHVTVKDIEQSIRFYSTLFGTEPSVRKDDYAKWMLEDPRLNFAISHRAEAVAGVTQYGVEHLGLQVDSREELDALGAQLKGAEVAVTPEVGTTCCYAQSDKGWVHDPQGLPWETFYTFGSATTYSGADTAGVGGNAACCTPAVQTAVVSAKIPVKSKANAACCG